MFSFFKKKPKDESAVSAEASADIDLLPPPDLTDAAPARGSWFSRLKSGLSKTSSSLTTLFIGARIDDDLYEELETALLISDAGVEATQFLLDGLKRKVKEEKLTEAEQVKFALKALLLDY